MKIYNENISSCRHSENKKIYVSGCLICGKPLLYFKKSKSRKCAICGHTFISNCECEAAHCVCDACHESEFITSLQEQLFASREKDPQKLLDMAMKLPLVHMHGPEHHVIVACVLLTAYRNNSGDVDLKKKFVEAVERGKQVPGGICGYWGACGASIGAGIYLSVLIGSDPLQEKIWSFPQSLVARCLEKNAEIGGPRCCKRTSRTAIETAVLFTSEYFGISMPQTKPVCRYMDINKECILTKCPFFRKKLTN